MKHINDIRFDEVTIRELDLVFSVLEQAPEYFKKVEGTIVTKEVAQREIESKPSKLNAKYEKKFLVVYGAEKPIGVIELHLNHPNESTAYIGLLLLIEEIQSQGMGRMIYEKLESICKEKFNINKIALGVSDDNDVSVFWQKMGFSFNGFTYIWKGLKKDTKVQEMEKNLN